MMFTCLRRIGDESALNCGKLAREHFEDIHYFPLHIGGIHLKVRMLLLITSP